MGVIVGPVGLPGIDPVSQTKVFEAVAFVIGKQGPGQGQGVPAGIGDLHGGFKKFQVELRIMEHQRQFPDELLEVCSAPLQRRSIVYLDLGDAGQLLDKGRHLPLGMDQGLEPGDDRPVFHPDRTQFDDLVPVPVQSGGLDVHRNKGEGL